MSYGAHCAAYRYREVVRKKAEREALPGFECGDCARFYAACESWLAPGDAPPPPPTCGHAAQTPRPGEACPHTHATADSGTPQVVSACCRREAAWPAAEKGRS
jgi:hypothetical protein